MCLVRFSLRNPKDRKSRQSRLAIPKMGSESKYKRDIWCGLTHFDWSFPNFCLGCCRLPRGKDINDHLFPLQLSVGHELPGVIVTVSFMMVADLQAATEGKNKTKKKPKL